MKKSNGRRLSTGWRSFAAKGSNDVIWSLLLRLIWAAGDAAYSGIGGQAVMEGVMMRNNEHFAVAVRKTDGGIAVVKDTYGSADAEKTIKKIPLVRGVFGFIDSLVLGMKSLNISTDFYTEEENEDLENAERSGDIETIEAGEHKKENGIVTAAVMVVAIVISIGLFMVLPYYASLLFGRWVKNPHLLSLIEGIIRIAVFVIYIKAISLMEDIKRVFRYHGAEHKCINCIETGNPLTIENVRKASKEHRRCGTSFLLYVMVISILFFSIIDAPNRAMRVVMRILLIPVIAGVSYEFIRLAGRSNNAVVRALSAPGLLMQRLTTAEPDDSMIEVGIASVEGCFDWRHYLWETFGVDAGLCPTGTESRPAGNDL